MIQVVGKQDGGVQTIHVCRCHLGRDPTLCPLVCPVQFAEKIFQSGELWSRIFLKPDYFLNVFLTC